MSEKLKAWMEQHEIGNTALAQALGFSREYVWQVANGQRPVTGEFRWRFAGLYGWDVARALFGDSEIADADPHLTQPA